MSHDQSYMVGNESRSTGERYLIADDREKWTTGLRFLALDLICTDYIFTLLLHTRIFGSGGVFFVQVF